MNYNKPPISFQEQINLLESRGLFIPDKSKALTCLQNISYYRFSAYALPFQLMKDQFNKGTSFDDILNLYNFDRELRILIMDAIERIEIALRTQFIYILSHKYGSHWQDDHTIFKKIKGIDVASEIQNIILKNCRSKYPEVFIKHYLDKYTNPQNPPSWMIIELFTIGQLSRLYSGLKKNDDKRDIASYFKLHHTIFESWLHCYTYGRNICAHHSRLWNRDFLIQPDIPKKNLSLPWLNASNPPNHRCFFFLCTIKYLLQIIHPNGDFKLKLMDILQKYQGVPIQFMGLPPVINGNLNNWQNEPLWQK